MLPLDVTPAQQAREDELRRALSEPQRAALFTGLWSTGRQLAEAGIRARNPGASEQLIRWLLTALLYDEATAVRLQGASPRQMSPLEIALEVSKALESIGAEYFVSGAVACSLHGHPRFTRNLDFVLSSRLSEVTLAEALGPDFDTPDHAAGDWNVFHLPTVTRVDFLSLKEDEYAGREFLRKRPFEVLPDQRLFLESPEDSVLRKLLWFREGGEQSAQQFRDVVNVLRVQGPALNTAYLDTWARKLDLVELLARARAAITT